MNDTSYLVDNNVLGRLTPAQRGSSFFAKYCRVPDEVLHEAGPGRAATVQGARYPTTAAVLRAMQTVMATVDAGDVKLVNLYRNTGTADPFLIACALVEQQNSADMLIRPEWVVVTEDEAVRRKAEEFDVPWISSTAFEAMLAAGHVGDGLQ
jgi:hypothetical protein